jgi:hypothetical protein
MKKLKNITTLLFLFFWTANSMFSQNTFKFRITDPTTDETVNDAVELPDGSFIMNCYNQVGWSGYFQNHLVRISASGKQIGSKEFYNQGQSSGLISLVQINQNKFLFAGFSFDIKYKIWFYETDSLLNEISSKVVSLDTNSLSVDHLLIDESSNIVCYGILTVPSELPYAFIYKFSPDLDSIQLKVFTDRSVLFPPSLLRKPDYSGYYFFLTGYHSTPYSCEALVNLDNSFKIKSISDIPKDVCEYTNTHWINNMTFILTARKDTLQENDRGLGVMVMDTNSRLKHNQYIGDHDTIDWPGMRKDLDFIDPDNIFVGSTHNACQFEICDKKSWYCLTNLDSLLNIKWQKFYGGTADFTLYGILATSDKGCLLYGTIYDSATQIDERDVYVIKVDQNGLVGIDEKNTSKLVHDAIVYPNPGSDYLNIESGPQISGAQFMMVTLDGKQVISKSLNQRIIKIDAELLSSGTYLWEIIFQGRIIESGKWVKE